MEKKEDRRVSMTKRMLKETLTEMLREMDIYHISIRDLCQRADINRSTFYKYYGNQFDLLADMENDLLVFLSKTIAEFADNPGKIIENSCRYMEQHLEFGRLIVNNNVDPLFPQKLFSLAAIRDVIRREYLDKQDPEMQEYLFNYIIYGGYRVICLWLNKTRRESPEQIAGVLTHLIRKETAWSMEKQQGESTPAVLRTGFF